MQSDLAIPSAIEAVIQQFEHGVAPYTVHDVCTALANAREDLQNPSDEEKYAAWAEVLAFALHADRTQQNPWRTYFGPIGSVTKEDGETVYFPNIKEADGRVIGHWQKRAQTIIHPVLKARYADLAWEMCPAISGTRRDPGMARVAIDAYLQSVALDSERYHRFETAIRALDLSVLIRDAERTARARSELLRQHREVMAILDGPWFVAYDRLSADKHAGTTDQERELLIADLEMLILHCGQSAKPGAFDPHAVLSAAQRLIRHYTRLRRTHDVNRLHEAVGRAFEHFASLGNALLASAALQTSVNAYRDAGMLDDSKRVRVLMQEKIAQSRDNMAAIETEVTITRDDIERFVKAIVCDDVGLTFARIASEFLPRRKSIEEQVQRSLKEAPLLSRIQQSIIADDHVAAKIGSVEDDPLGRLLQQTNLNVTLSGVWLQVTLERAVESHDVQVEHIVAWANRTALFDDVTLLMEGVRAWFEGDLMKAVHVLVPQVERGLRSIVAALGKPVTKAHSTIADISVSIGMGDILYQDQLTEALGPDLTLYFLALYADPRGMNLRNRVAHGLITAEFCDSNLVRLLIHTLLVFGLWKELAAQRR